MFTSSKSARESASGYADDALGATGHALESTKEFASQALDRAGEKVRDLRYGATDLARFYAEHFIPKCPKDTRLVPISRTIGVDRLVDEMLFCFTHDIEIDWMLPGIPPTGRPVEIPLVAIVNFRGDKLYHEHIYWDQASVLMQIGLLDPKGLPVVGAESARRVLNPKLPARRM